MKEQLKVGMVLNLEENNLSITENYGVLLGGTFPVGSLNGNLRWFTETLPPDPASIKLIVYLGGYKWGLKQLKSRYDEFMALTTHQQEAVMDNYFRLLDDEDDRQSILER